VVNDKIPFSRFLRYVDFCHFCDFSILTYGKGWQRLDKCPFLSLFWIEFFEDLFKNPRFRLWCTGRPSYFWPQKGSRDPLRDPPRDPKTSCFINYMVSDRRRPIFWHFETQFDVHMSKSTPKTQNFDPKMTI
jgi:hypothetical protein